MNRIIDRFKWHLSDYLICKSKVYIKGAEGNTLIHGYIVRCLNSLRHTYFILILLLSAETLNIVFSIYFKFSS